MNLMTSQEKYYLRRFCLFCDKNNFNPKSLGCSVLDGSVVHIDLEKAHKALKPGPLPSLSSNLNDHIEGHWRGVLDNYITAVYQNSTESIERQRKVEKL